MATKTLSQIRVQRHTPRCPSGLIALLAQASTGWIVDANGKRGALGAEIRPVGSAVSFCGSAFTVWSRGRDNLAAYAALQYAKAGDVLVLATDAYQESSVVGDVFVGLARNLGIVAIVTDGMVRDVSGIEAVGIPVFARGLSPNSPHKDGPGEIGTQVCLGGVGVRSGDVIRGDADGVVVVAQAQAVTVVADLERVRAQEARMDQWVRDGLTSPPWLADMLTADRIEYLE